MVDQKLYTAADFIRYRSGKMNAAEMHALEKAALADPFLADALEGYFHADHAEEDLAMLRRKIDNKREIGAVVPLSSRTAALWRAAAAFIFIAGAAWLFTRFNKHESPHNIAQNQTPHVAQQDSAVGGFVSNYDGPVNTRAVTPPLRDSADVKAHVNRNAAPPIALTSPAGVVSILKPINNRANDNFYAPTGTASSAGIPQPTEPSSATRPQPGDSESQKSFVAVNNDNAVTVRESAKEKVNQRVPAAVASADYFNETDRDKTTADKSADIKERPLEFSQDIAENKASLQRGIDEKGFVLPKYGRMEPVDSVVFNDYLVNNVKLLTDSAGAPAGGTVVLSFTVNKAGRPENIRVEKSLCKTCDEQAVLLLKNGPRWIYAQARRKKTVVTYSPLPDKSFGQ